MWKIRAHRSEIDKLNTEILNLINQRAEIAQKIGRMKVSQGLPIYSPKREKDILTQVIRENNGPLSDVSIKNIFSIIIEETRKLEEEVDQNGSSNEA